MNFKLLIMALISFVAIIGISNATSPTMPSNVILNYSTITISYNGMLSYPNPFQQEISLTENTFGNYIAYNNNFANFEFFNQSGAVIPAWIESNSSGTLTIWLKLNGANKLLQTGSSSATENIYLGFASKTTNLLSNSGTTGIGEAPQLSNSYGQYDDGASVFNYYTNFSGTSLPTNWNVYGTGSSYSVNNGITIGSDVSTGVNFGVAYTIIQNYPQIAEAYVVSDHITGGSPTAGIEVFENLVIGPNGFENGYNFGAGGTMTTSSSINVYNSAGDNVELVTGSGTNTPIVLSALWYATGNEIMYENYATTLSTTDSSVSIGNYYFGFLDSGGAQQHYTTYQWFRLRAVPPSITYPSTSLSSIESYSASTTSTASYNAYPTLAEVTIQSFQPTINPDDTTNTNAQSYPSLKPTWYFER